MSSPSHSLEARHHAFVRNRFAWLIWLALFALLLALFGLPRAAAAQSYPVTLTYATGSIPHAVAVGDLNGDGKLDMVVANYGAATAGVLLSTGGGQFGSMTTYVTGSMPIALALGDLNGDGRPDMVTANEGSNTISVLINTGTGTFGARTDYVAGNQPYALVLADLDGDGRLDIVAANYGSNNVTVLLGNGSGGVAARADFAAGSGPEGVAAGELNGDGVPDLVVSNYNASTVSVLLGMGAGRFGAKSDYATGSGPEGLVLADVNDDGRLDVAVTDYTASTISVLLGTGTGSLGAKADYATNTGPAAIAAADLNADGTIDLAVADEGAGYVSVMLGIGTGAYGARTDYATGNAPYGVATGDLNGDGRLDVVTANFSSSTLTVLLSGSVVAAGALGAYSSYTVPGPAFAVAVGDLNADGRPDVVAANYNYSTVSVLLNSSSGLGAKTDFGTGNCPGDGPNGVALADVNNDGKLDIVTSNYCSNTASVLLGVGDGTFGAKADFVTGIGPAGVALGDFNGDGKLDLAVANVTASTVSVLLGTGTGSFGPKTDYVVGVGPFSLALADFNGDGKLDIVTGNYLASTVSVLLGTGAGSFAAHADYATGNTPYCVIAVDVNGDTKKDAITANYGANTMSVLPGTGAGGFTAHADYPAGTYPWAVGAADMNGDGKLDLVVTNRASGTASVFLCNAGGAITQRTDYAAPGACGLAIADMNADGRLDLVTGCGGNLVYLEPALEASQVTLTSSPNPVAADAPVTLTATLGAVSPITGTPSGSVYFWDGTTLLGSQLVGSSGSGAITAFLSATGKHLLTATYAGNTTQFLGATSAMVTQTVTGPSCLPVIASVRDVANDQGGEVRLAWNASSFDTDPPTIVDAYWLWRQAPAQLAQQALAAGAPLPYSNGASAAARGRIFMTSVEGGLTYYWEYVSSVTAHGMPGYSAVVATTGDSVAGSNPYTLFLVQARCSTTGQHWDSAPDSGYSVDNLAPIAPVPFTGEYLAGTARLHWDPNAEADLAGYRLYRGTSAGFTPSAGNRIAAQADTGYADAAGAPCYYKLSAVDIHGNESGWTTLLPGGTTDVPAVGAPAFALGGVSPNPARGGELTVSFALPDGAPATLTLLDVSGRRVMEREVGALGAGRHAVSLSSAGLRPGLYVVRLARGGVSLTARVAVIE